MEEKRKKFSKKQKLLLALGIVLATLLFLIVIVGILDRIYGLFAPPDWVYSYDPFENPSGTLFYEADYSENIFEDEAYLSKNRYMKFSNGAYAVTYTEEELRSAPEDVLFFAGYFDAVIKGDAKTYNSLFTDAYYENFGKPIEPYERFTMQKVYDISVTLVKQDAIKDAGGEIIRGMYEVSYKIYQNNGTFRPDIFDDETLPLIFETVSQNGEMKINSIVLPKEWKR